MREHVRYPWAEDFEGRWHVRRTEGSDRHEYLAACGAWIRSVHVSEYSPTPERGEANPICTGCLDRIAQDWFARSTLIAASL